MKIELWYKDNILKNYLKFRDEDELDVELIDEYRMIIRGIKSMYNNNKGEGIKVNFDSFNSKCIYINLEDVDCYFVKLDYDDEN